MEYWLTVYTARSLAVPDLACVRPFFVVTDLYLHIFKHIKLLFFQCLVVGVSFGVAWATVPRAPKSGNGQWYGFGRTQGQGLIAYCLHFSGVPRISGSRDSKTWRRPCPKKTDDLFLVVTTNKHFFILGITAPPPEVP